MANANRRFQVNHGFFSLLGANMHPSWHLKTMETNKKGGARECPKSVQFSRSFLSASGALLGANSAPSWRPGQAKTAPKSAQEPPRTALETAPRPSGSAKRTQHATDLQKRSPGPSKKTQFSWILTSICVDFKRIFDQVLDRFCLHAWLRSDYATEGK